MRLLAWLAAGAFLLSASSNAWLCDDAYITFRTAINLLKGLGPVYNAGERVQTYTNPLWMLTLAGGFSLTNNVFLAAAALSLMCVAGTVWNLARRVAVDARVAVVVLSMLLFSKFAVEYATSGMETAPGMLLTAAFYAVLTGSLPPARRVPRMTLLAALAMVNRMDAVALLAPPLALELWRWRGRYRWRGVAAALTPLAAWCGFALFYYGFLMPNTAYAKVFAGLPLMEVWERGWSYLGLSLELDPVLALVLVLGLGGAVLRRRRRERAIALGIVLHLLYVVHVGGDFMAGRFLLTPGVAALALIARWRLTPRRMTILLLVLALAGGPAFVRLNLMSDPFPKVREAYNYRHGITDEHAYYRRLTGLGVIDLQSDLARCVWRDAPAPAGDAARKIVQVESTGMHGFRHGPEYYMLDAYALINPLMARLPALRDPNWLPGHLNRLVPPELVRSLREGSNRLTDPALAEYYDRLNLITRGPLLTRARLIEIARMNLGWNASLIDRARYAAPPAAAGPIRRAVSAAPLQINRGWNDGGNVFFGARGLTIDLDRPARGVRRVELALVTRNAYQVELWRNGRRVHAATFAVHVVPGRFEICRIDVPEAVRGEGFDRVVIRPLGIGFWPVFGGIRCE